MVRYGYTALMKLMLALFVSTRIGSRFVSERLFH